MQNAILAFFKKVTKAEGMNNKLEKNPVGRLYHGGVALSIAGTCNKSNIESCGHCGRT